MTDTGIATGESREALAGCRVLALETNHDINMLAHGPYPGYLKARIASDHGHLSNVQGADLLSTLLCDELEQVVGMHISQNNNTYRLPGDALNEVLRRECHPASARVGYQDKPLSV
jgi:phosphoribosyl 1,2-cyclic phosphodiesterase